MDNAITKMFGNFYIAFEMELDKDKIVDVNHNILEDEELLRKEVVTRYFGSSTKAILTAYHDALQRYKKVKSELIKER